MNRIVKRIVSGIMAGAISASYLGIVPLENVIAKGNKADNETLYASILNNYTENVIPKGLMNLDSTSAMWNYSDMWMYTTGNLSDYEYAFYDLDGNGVDELFILDNTYSIKINEIYTVIDGTPKQVATGGARWDYFVTNSGNVLGEFGSGGATYHGYTFYHLINGALVAFEKYINDNGTWYYVSGDNCNEAEQSSMQMVSEDSVYAQHPEISVDIDIPGFNEEIYPFSEYGVSDNQAATIAENQCGDNAFWEFDQSTGTLKISGTGPMYDYDDADPFFSYDPKRDPSYSMNQGYTKSVEIEEGITSIGNKAFYGSNDISKCKLPESLESIGNLAFYSDGRSDILTSITIPKNVTHIGEKAVGYHIYDVSNKDGLITSEEKIPGFIIYGYQGSAADSYAKQNGFDFVALDVLEESTEAESSKEQQLNIDFIKHHVGVAQLDENRSIWNYSEDIDTLYQLAEFDYYYGNTGVGFATDAYSNLGNPIAIIEAGRKAKDMYSSASEIMYYQALLKLMYHTSEENSFNLIKGYYLQTLEEFSEQLNNAGMASSVQSLVKTTVEIGENITQADSLKKIKDAMEKFDNAFEITDLPIKDFKNKNLGIGTGDILSLVASVAEIQSNKIKNVSDILNCVVYFKMFCSIQDDYKIILNQMYQTASEDNETYKTALQNLKECISAPSIETFINNYFSKQKEKIEEDSTKNIRMTIAMFIGMKLAEIIPGGNVLQILDDAGNVVDFCFDKMNSTEEKIASIGELVCHYEIIHSLQNVGNQYKTDLIGMQNFENATKYHEVIDLYYDALKNYCVYGNEFLSLFVSSYYSINIDRSKNFADNTAVMMKDNLVFKYIATTFENDQADDYLNHIFGISNGDYVSWYRKIITLQASIKELSTTSHHFICCETWTDDEIDRFLDDAMASAMEKAKNYVETKVSDWKTFFVGCPVNTKVYDENGTAVATIENGNIAVHNLDLFMNVFCYTIEETEDNSYGVVMMLPNSYTFTVSAQTDCNVIFQQADSNDFSEITLSGNAWQSSVKKMKKGDVLHSDSTIVSTEENDHISWKLVLIIGTIIIIVGASVASVVIVKKK